ncbi:unnamed protein product, partial [Schistosoma bovis]
MKRNFLLTVCTSSILRFVDVFLFVHFPGYLFSRVVYANRLVLPQVHSYSITNSFYLVSSVLKAYKANEMCSFVCTGTSH